MPVAPLTTCFVDRLGGESLPIRRRAFLGAASSIPLSLTRVPVAADGVVGGEVTLLVAGPQNSRLDRLAAVLAPVLGRGLPVGTTVRRLPMGGSDGVTGANQFEARISPDGRTVLLLPGETALAWLEGDPRAHFDPARWVPVMAGVMPGVVLSRVPSDALRPGAKLRFGAAGPAGPDLAALLAIEMLGVETVPLFGLRTPREAAEALAAHSVDALFLRGDSALPWAVGWAQAGIRPIFSLGLPNDIGELARDPRFAETPTLVELLLSLGRPPVGALFNAWRAVAAAAQTAYALVLPQLAPASLVSLWRRAAAQATLAPEIQVAKPQGVRSIAAPAAALPILTADTEALLALRRWLAGRFDWQPA